jgi:hypothetical protein
MRRRVIHGAPTVRPSRSLAVRAGLVHTFGSLAGFVVATFLCWASISWLMPLPIPLKREPRR